MESVDVTALAELLDEPHAETRRKVKELLSGPDFAYRYGDDLATQREGVMRWCRRLAEEGWGAVGYPPEVGGQGDPGRFAAVAETLGLHDLSLLVKFGVQFGLFAGAILNLGTELHHRRYLPPALTLELPGCFAMTETDHGSDVRSLETVAVYRPEQGDFLLDTPHEGARKDYIGNAGLHARLAVVFAQLQVGEIRHGVHALLVPLRDDQGRLLAGIEIEDCGVKVGLNGVDNARIRFREVTVPRENLLDRYGRVEADGRYRSPIEDPSRRFFTMIGTLVVGRVSLAAAAVSAAKTAVTIAVRYGERRRQFALPDGDEIPLLDYLSHQRRLLPRLAATYAWHFAVRDLVEGYVEAGDARSRREVEARAAALKAAVGRHALDTVQACREACGGQGYLAVNRFADLRSDLDAFTTFEGDNTVLLQLVTRSLLAEYRQQFEDMNLLELVRYLAGRAVAAFGESELLAGRATDEEHLRDRQFQLESLRWREDHLLAGLARRLRRMAGEGLDLHRAFLACQDHALAVGRAHAERLALESFARAVDACGDQALSGVLGSLCDLFALERMEADRGWFQEHGQMSGGKAKAVRDAVNRLCAEMRPQAVALVDAFGIPDPLLGAPIARGA